MRTAAFALPILLAACGATSERIRGPDGQVWVSIQCRRSQANCYAEAGEQCPYGYVAGAETGHTGQFTSVNVSQYGGSGYSVPTYNGTLMVRCKAPSDGAPLSAGVSPPSAPPAPAVPASLVSAPAARDLSICLKDAEHLNDVGAWWSAQHPEGAPLAHPPTLEAFVTLCGRLPESAQLCLGPVYRGAHEAECAEVFAAFSPRVVAAVSSLFLQSGGEK
jgi:hypothetical protein